MTAYYVYRAFDESGRALYVGCTGNLAQRLARHRVHAPWARRCVRISATVHASKGDACTRERELIAALSPRFNITGRWQSRHEWDASQYIDCLAALRAAVGPHGPSLLQARRIQVIEQELAAITTTYDVDQVA